LNYYRAVRTYSVVSVANGLYKLFGRSEALRRGTDKNEIVSVGV
jgi:hypothetical protein